MSGLSKGFSDPSIASTSQECQGEVEKRTLGVTLLSSEWRSSTDGDVSTINRELAIQLAKHPNVQVSVFLPQCSEEDKRIATNLNVQLIEAEEVAGFDPVDWLINIPENHAMDCIIGHGVRLGRQIPLIKRFHHHCKWIQVVHTAPEELGMYKSISEGEQMQQTEIELCEKADQVVAVGPKLADAYKRYLRSGEKDQNVLNLTPSIFTEFLDVQQATEERKTFCVLVIMSGESEDFNLKGYDLAAQAIAELKDKSYQLRFICAPTEEGDKMAERLLQHGIARYQLIVRIFNESRDVLARLFCEVDLAIMPSRTEGFGLTALEALSAGLPVLVSGNSGLGEALRKVPTGSTYVVDSEDPKDWAKAIKAVRQKDRDVRLDESKCLREKYLEKYSWQKACGYLVKKMQEFVFGPPALLPSSVEHSHMPSNVTTQTYQGPYHTQNKIRNDIEKLNEKLNTFMAAKEGSSSKDKDDFDPAELIDGIRQLYKLREGWLAPFPWCEEFHFHLDNIYTRLKVISRKKERGTATSNTVDMSGIFKPHEECSQPRAVLIEGTPGMGKTTYCKKLVYDWATGNQEAEDGFPRFDTVLLLRCRDMKSDLWEAIDDQLLPRDVKEEVRERFFDFIRHNQSNILLILDGLDEVPANKLPMFSEIIQGRSLPKCRLVVTARHEVGVKVRICCDTLLEIEGFTEKDAWEFISKYFKTRKDLANKLLDKLLYDRNLETLTRNPLNTALLCLVCEDQGTFPENRSQLFLEMIQCILRRYRKKEGLSEIEDDLLEVYKTQLKHLGWIAFEGLRKDSLDFEESELANHLNVLSRFGILSVQLGASKLRPCRRYSFLHKSFQEWFAAFYLCSQLVEEKISPEKLLNEFEMDKLYNGFDMENFRFFEVLCFALDMLAAQCEELAVALLKSMAARVKGDYRFPFRLPFFDWFLLGIRLIGESQSNSNFFVKLARGFGSSLKCKTLAFDFVNLAGVSAICSLAEALKANTTVESMSLGYPVDLHAVQIADTLKENSTLTTLELELCSFDDQVAARLAEALEVNKTLRSLTLAVDDDDSAGYAELADALKVNTGLTEWYLRNNNIGDQGAACFAEALKDNNTLTKLHLSSCDIGKGGGADLADALKVNTTLTELSFDSIKIGDEGAARFAEALRVNKTLTKLHLSLCDIGKDGGADLADALKVNTTLTELSCDTTKIGDEGAARFAEALRVNKTLKMLGLRWNGIGNGGATCLADALKSNTDLIELNLSYNIIGMDGFASLIDGLQHNTTLAKLNLSNIFRTPNPSHFDCPRDKAVVTEFVRLVRAGRVDFP